MADPPPATPPDDLPPDAASDPEGTATATTSVQTRSGLSSLWKRRIALGVVVLLALLFGLWGLWRVWVPAPDDVRAGLAASEQKRLEQLELLKQVQQTVSTLRRSDQISRDANRDLQGSLAERNEEIAALRADVAFYERLVGSTAQRHGLAVHSLLMQPQNNTAWHFTTTITQNLNRGAVSSGRLTMAVEGTRAGKLQTLEWSDLRQQEDAEGEEYSFKYFEQIEGDVFLPPGFTPVRVTVRLQPGSGKAVEHAFTWAESRRGPIQQ